MRLCDSQYFLFPLVLGRRTRGVQTEPLYTLSQLFIEICRPEISRRTVHLQVYTYSDLIGQAVRKTFGPLARPLEILARQLEERMVIIQGYLHSDESQTISMTLKRGGADGPDCLQVAAQPNPGDTPHGQTGAGRNAAKLAAARRNGSAADAANGRAGPRVPQRRLVSHARKTGRV